MSPTLFIRRATTCQSANGQSPTLPIGLVCSQRVGHGVRQRTLLNLGRHFEIPPEHWRRLCARLEQLLEGQQALMPVVCPPAGSTISETDAVASEERFHTVDVDSLERAWPRSVGVEPVGLWAMEQAGFLELLKELGLTGPMRAVVGSVIGRRALQGEAQRLCAGSRRCLRARRGKPETLPKDARGAQCPERGAGGYGPRDRDRGQCQVVAPRRISLLFRSAVSGRGHFRGRPGSPSVLLFRAAGRERARHRASRPR